MNATHDTTTTEETTIDAAPVHPVDYADAMNWAIGFVNASTNMHVYSLLPEAAEALYAGTNDLFQSPESSLNARLATVLCLDALATSPEALAEVARRLRARLIETDPRLQVLYGDSHE